MKIKLPVAFATLAGHSQKPLPLVSEPRRTQILSATAVKSAPNEIPEDSNGNPVSNFWREVGVNQHSIMGAMSSQIVKVGNTTGAAFETLISETRQRAMEVGVIPELILMESDQSVLLQPLGKAVTVKLVEERLGITIGSMVVGPGGRSALDDSKFATMLEKLKAGDAVGLVAVDDFHAHSAGMTLQYDPESSTLHAVSFDSINIFDNLLKSATADRFGRALDASLEFKTASSVSSQADTTSCHTISCIVVPDILETADAGFTINFKEGDYLPPQFLRTGQTTQFLASGNYDPESAYRSDRSQTLGEHRAEHLVKCDDDKELSHFLIAKTLQFANTTLNYLEGIDKERMDDTVRGLLLEAYPGNMVASFRRM